MAKVDQNLRPRKQYCLTMMLELRFSNLSRMLTVFDYQ